MNEKQLDKAIKITVVLLVISVVLSAFFFYKNRLSLKYKSTPIIDQQIDVLQEKVEKQPGSYDLRILLAKKLLDRGYKNEAIENLEAALKIKKKSIAAHYLLGVAYKDEDKAKAIAEFKKTLEIGKNQQFARINTYLRDANFYLAETYFQDKKYKDSLKYYKEATKIGTADSDTFYKIGQVYVALKDYKNAMLQYDKALMFVPNYKEVLIDYEKTLEKMPNYADGYYNLGKVYAFLNQLYTNGGDKDKASKSLEKAKSLYNKALDVDPNHQKAKKALANLAQ